LSPGGRKKERQTASDVHGGVTNLNLPEAEIKRAMLLAARRPAVAAELAAAGCDVQIAR
jgi:hypothetical protein